MSLYIQQNPSLFPARPGNDRGKGQAIVGLTLGLMSILTWLVAPGSVLVTNWSAFEAEAQVLGILFWLALLGAVLVALTGLVFSALGLHARSRKSLAIAGLVLSLLGLVLAIGTPLFFLAKVISEI